MEEGSEELQQAREEKKETWARKKAHMAKYKKYSHLSQYATKEEDLTARQMAKAQRRKRRFLNFANREAKRGEVAEEEVRKIQSMPVWSFYELDLVQLARWAKGKYPFAPEFSKRKTMSQVEYNEYRQAGSELPNGDKEELERVAEGGEGEREEELDNSLTGSMGSGESSESDYNSDDPDMSN